MPGVRAGAGPKGSVWMRRGVDSDRGQAGADLVHERSSGPHRYASASRGGVELDEQRRGEAARVVEVAAFDVVGARAAVADDGVDVRERCEQRAGFGGEGVLVGCCARRAATRSPARSAPPARAWSMASTGVAPMPALTSSTGALVRSRMKVPRGAAIVELVADAEAGVQVAAGGAVGFALDADPVVAGVGRTERE